VDQQLDQLSVGHQELGNQIHVPVPATPETLAGRLQAVALEELLQRRYGGRLAAIVLVPINMQHLLAGHGQHPAEDALLQARSQHNRVVFLIHFGSGSG